MSRRRRFQAEVARLLRSLEGAAPELGPSPLIPSVKEILEHEAVFQVWPRVEAIRKGDNDFALDLLLFAAGLKRDWESLAKVPRDELADNVAKTMEACERAATLLEKHAAEVAAWNGQPVSEISLREDLRRVFSLPPGPGHERQLFGLRQLLAGDDMANLVEALPQLARMLRSVSKMTAAVPLTEFRSVARRGRGRASQVTRRMPAALVVMPTRVRDEDTGRVSFFIRHLTWFVAERAKRADDLVVAAVASAISGKTVDEAQARSRREELEAQFEPQPRVRASRKTTNGDTPR